MTEVTPNLPHFGSFCKYCFMGTLLQGTHAQLLAKQGVYYRLWNQLPAEDEE